MTPFSKQLTEIIARRLSIQMGHGSPPAPGFFEWAEEIISDIRPVVNAEVARLIENERLSPPTREEGVRGND
jgi:hypothetical protein